MTLVIAASLVSGGILILSAINDWSLRETVLRVFSGDLDPKSPAPSNSKVTEPGFDTVPGSNPNDPNNKASKLR